MCGSTKSNPRSPPKLPDNPMWGRHPCAAACPLAGFELTTLQYKAVRWSGPQGGVDSKVEWTPRWSGLQGGVHPFGETTKLEIEDEPGTPTTLAQSLRTRGQSSSSKSHKTDKGAAVDRNAYSANNLLTLRSRDRQGDGLRSAQPHGGAGCVMSRLLTHPEKLSVSLWNRLRCHAVIPA
jgi:hypothetical protein